MPVSLQFYNTTDNPKKINKTLSAVGAAISLAPFEDFDLENPYVIINNGVAVGNYAKIDNDYFFANEPILMTGKRKMVRFTKDVLMSNKAQLLNVEVIADRSSNYYNSYITDPTVKFQTNSETINYKLQTIGTWQNDAVIVVTIGGKEL